MVTLIEYCAGLPALEFLLQVVLLPLAVIHLLVYLSAPIESGFTKEHWFYKDYRGLVWAIGWAYFYVLFFLGFFRIFGTEPGVWLFPYTLLSIAWACFLGFFSDAFWRDFCEELGF